MTSRTRHAERFRCNVCRTRWRHRKKRKTEPKCPYCKETIRIRSIEQERRRELAKQDACHCNAYPFPHRKGTLRMRHHHPMIDVEPTDEEIYDYEACLATPRSGWC